MFWMRGEKKVMTGYKCAVFTDTLAGEEKLHRPVGLMDKASASRAGDSRFESWAGQFAVIGLRDTAGNKGNVLGSYLTTVATFWALCDAAPLLM